MHGNVYQASKVLRPLCIGKSIKGRWKMMGMPGPNLFVIASLRLVGILYAVNYEMQYRSENLDDSNTLWISQVLRSCCK